MNGSDRTVRLLGGGTDGNERLTAAVSLILLVLLAAIGVTILRIGQLIRSASSFGSRSPACTS